jgi:prevent-host-death family protein
MTAPQRSSISSRDLSRRAAAVLDRVEQGERLIVTRDGEPVAEIIPIDRSERTLARWVREGVIAPAAGTWLCQGRGGLARGAAAATS